MTTDGGAPATSRVAAAVAALTSLGLGGIAALAWVAGHHRWDGPMTDSGVGSHGQPHGQAVAHLYLHPHALGQALRRQVGQGRQGAVQLDARGN